MGTDGETIALDQKLARILVRPLARTALHPNWLTALGLGLGAVAAGLFALGIERTVQNLAVFVYVLAIFMDHTDGELARMTGKTSRAGHYFDHVQAVFNYTSGWVGIGNRAGPGPSRGDGDLDGHRCGSWLCRDFWRPPGA